MPDKPRNVGASVRQRLLNLARARSQPLELLLTRYALERLLHRLSLSSHLRAYPLETVMLGTLVAELRASVSALFKPQ
jgi:hypothetical protein